MRRRHPRLLTAFLVGATLGLALRMCGDGGAHLGVSEEAAGAYDSTIAAEVERWRTEAEASAARAESLAVAVRRWEAEAEARRRTWAEARQRLDELDEVRDELDAMEPDSLGALAGAVLRRRIGERSALRLRSGTER